MTKVLKVKYQRASIFFQLNRHDVSCDFLIFFLLGFGKNVRLDFFLFIQKHIYNGHINKMKKSKAKIHIIVIRCKANITPEIKSKEEQLQN